MLGRVGVYLRFDERTIMSLLIRSGQRHHRDVWPPCRAASGRLRTIGNGIIRRLEGSGETEVRSEDIGQLIMDALASLDQVAYVRFASVYRNFREAGDIEDFLGALNVDDKHEDDEPAWPTDI